MADFSFRLRLNVPIRETVKEVDSNTWLIGPYILHRSSGHSDDATWYDDEDNSSYTITDAPSPPPAATLLPPSGTPFVEVEDVGDAQNVWYIGNKAVCKVQVQYPDLPRSPEDVTIKWVQEKQPTFKLPEVIRYTEQDHRSILIYTRLPGQPLGYAWLGLSKEQRRFYVNKVADVIRSMAQWTNDKICAVDGQPVLNLYLVARRDATFEDLKPENLERDCREMGMDCSTFSFFHGMLGPQQVIVDGDNIGIIDWDLAGFFPKGWITTHLGVCGDYNTPEDVKEIKDPSFYRREIGKQLEDEGWGRHLSEYMARLDGPVTHQKRVADEDIGS